jgi:hypothetical protein
MKRTLRGGRRSFLAFSTGLIATFGVARMSAARTQPEVDTAQALVDSIKMDRDAALGIAIPHWRRLPEERNVKQLLARFGEANGDIVSVATSTDRGTLRRLLRQRIRDDFSRGQTINIDGWVLSATEVRLCALTARLSV